MDRLDVAVTMPWMGAGTEFLVRMVDALPDDALQVRSGLPGWSRAHVVAHVARNAEALTRLATWARTGVEIPMYADGEQRAAEIESSAKAPAETLRRELGSTADALDAALAALDDHTWQAKVRSALGRTITAAEVPWMRVREVWLHAVDLDAGADVDDLPPEVVDALLDDAAAAMSGREGCPSVLLDPRDRDRVWNVGGGAKVLRGSAADLLAWLTGRPTTIDAPNPPRWL